MVMIFFNFNMAPKPERIVNNTSVLVVSNAKKPKDSLELPSIDIEIIANIWKSVVKITCHEFVGSGLVIDKAEEDGEDQGLYILTNLHLLQDQPDILSRVSADFKNQVKKLDKLGIHGKRRNQQNSDSKGPLKVLIEQNCDGRMVYVTEFVLDKEVCWEASATLDYMILKVPLPANCSLQMCEYHSYHSDTMPVHIFGFPGAFSGDYSFKHQYAIIPAQITSKDVTGQIFLTTPSTSGLSGSAIVCTGRGCAVGYLGLGLNPIVNRQHQCYGHLFIIPPYLPRFSMNQ